MNRKYQICIILLADNGAEYSDEERAVLEESLEEIASLIETIENAEAAEGAILALPESVDPDDTEAEEQIAAAKGLYDALNEYEKGLVSDEAAEKLKTLLTQLTDYRIIEGDGSIWTKGSREELTFVANGACGKFTGIEIDGMAVDAENYIVESGSTVITLKSDYLNTLTAEEHTITVLYTDGGATGTFIIAEKPADTISPQTGNDSHIVLWIMMMLISGGTVLTDCVKIFSQK